MKPVRAGRTAIGAGVLAALYVIVAYTVHTVPDWTVALFGGPSKPIDRWGGWHVDYRDAGGAERSIDYPGAREDAKDELLNVVINGGMTMQEVIDDTDHAIKIGEGDDVFMEWDQWAAADGGQLHTSAYLYSHSLTALRAQLDAGFERGYTLPPGTEIWFELIEPPPEVRDRRPVIRTYLLSIKAEIDGSMVTNAMHSYDPNTGRPIVLIDFTDDGARRLCALTKRIVGKKLATTVGGRIRSAPIINGAICGGRASVMMGGGDAARQEHEADALVSALRTGPWLGGSELVKHEWKPPAHAGLQEWLGRLLFGLIAGLGVGVIVFFVLRFARPHTREVTRVDGPFPWRRLLVVALAPVALIVGAWFTLPGLNEVELVHIMRGNLNEQWSVIGLGLSPIISAYLTVEVIALAAPSLRWRRHDPVGRIGLGKAVALVGISIALAQGYFFASFIAKMSSSPFGVEITNMDGWKLQLLIMTSLAAGTCLLAIIAGMIREHGLGNGYAVLMATAFVLELVDSPTRIEIAGVVVIAIATRYVLRWRIANDREPALRLPSCGAPPLNQVATLIYVVAALAYIGMGADAETLTFQIDKLRFDDVLALALVAVSIPAWAWVFARPRIVERVAMQAGLDRPTQRMWIRGLAISFVLIAGLAAVGIATAASVMILTATLLDITDDARAHRRKLVPAGVIHQVQYVGAVERVLQDAGIQPHFHASNIRTILAFFGPFAPVIVMVPEEFGESARTKLDDVLRASRATVPQAKVSEGNVA